MNFSEFIRNGTKEEKQKVLLEVIEESIKEQRMTTNNEGETPVQRFRKLWGSITKENDHLTTERIEALISQEIERAREEGIKTSNSGKRMYEIGREDMRKECLKAVPEGKLVAKPEHIVEMIQAQEMACRRSFNDCREQTITNITKIV